MDLAPFVRLIKERCGLFINDPKHSSLTQAIRERMSSTGLNCHAKYFNIILDDAKETLRLVDLLTNNETYFFRESKHFKLFSDKLVPELLKNKREEEKIKVLSAGCSTGEEPYSLVISLIKKFGPKIMDSINVIGCDINQKAIQSARMGVYKEHSFRNVEKEFREEYFDRLSGERYQLKDYVRDSVEFIIWNMVSDIYPRSLVNANIIFYRNVSIYFEPDTRRKVFLRLSDLLSDNGYLFLSSSETFSHNMGSLFLEEREEVFLYRKNATLRLNHQKNMRSATLAPSKNGSEITQNRSGIADHCPPVQSDSQKDKGKLKSEDIHALFEKALGHAKKKEIEKALQYLDTLLAGSSSFAKAYNLKASILIHQQRFDEAKSHCLKTLELDEWNLECHILLGLIAKIEGNEREALIHFKGALYIDPGCWLAHMHRGDIHNALGELESACRDYGLAAKLLEKNGKEQENYFLFPLAFPREQVIHLCNHNIKNLKQRLSP
jgi:chemotaxis protein methyltransferase CheR